MHRVKFLVIKPNRCTNFLIYYWNKTLHVLDSSSVHHREFFTVHTAMVNVIQVCWQLVSRSICSCSQAVNKPVWHLPLLCVQWKTPDDGQRNCPKHVEFHSKIKLLNWQEAEKCNILVRIQTFSQNIQWQHHKWKKKKKLENSKFTSRAW